MFTRKNAAILATFLFFVALAVGAGWGIATYIGSSSNDSSVSENPPAAQSTPTEVGPLPEMEQPMPNLDGEWSATAHGTRFVATVGNNVITIVMNRDNTSVMYWNGSFEQTGGDMVASNKIETDSIVLSGAAAKTFTVGVDKLSFEFRAMGMTEVVVLTRA